jgi:hypothetical protein
MGPKLMDVYGHMPGLIASSSAERLPVVSDGSDSDESLTSSSSDDVGPPPLLHVCDVGDSSSSEDERHPPHLEHYCSLYEWLSATHRDIVGFVDRNGSMVGPFMLTCGDAIRVRPLARATSSDPLLWSRSKYLEWFLDNKVLVEEAKDSSASSTSDVSAAIERRWGSRWVGWHSRDTWSKPDPACVNWGSARGTIPKPPRNSASYAGREKNHTRRRGRWRNRHSMSKKSWLKKFQKGTTQLVWGEGKTVTFYSTLLQDF